MRRKKGQLLPLERQILGVLRDSQGSDGEPRHGFAIAKQLAEGEQMRSLTAHGTLYKALDRLDGAGLVRSRWESVSAASEEGRPRRRLYRITAPGQKKLAASLAVEGDAAADLRWRTA